MLQQWEVVDNDLKDFEDLKIKKGKLAQFNLNQILDLFTYDEFLN